MTRLEYGRWINFSIRMAKHAWPNMTEQRKKRLKEEILSFFQWELKDCPDYIAAVDDWDTSPDRDQYCLCSSVDSFFDQFEHWDERTGERKDNRFFTQIVCCIRAGFDIAVKQSGGVLGFTVGDLRRMFPNGLPAWVTKDFVPPLTIDTPDSGSIWL